MRYYYPPPMTRAERNRRARLRYHELPGEPEQCRRAVLDLIRSAHFTIPEMMRILGLSRSQLSSAVSELRRQGHRIRPLRDAHGLRYALFLPEPQSPCF